MKVKAAGHYDYLIVGAGLYGATFAYLAKKQGKRSLVVEKRPHVGGNLYCEDIDGVNVHKYGAHIFHTSNSRVWRFVNSIVPFNRYTNSPLAKAPDGGVYNLPFNMNTFYRLWGLSDPEDVVKKLEDQKSEALRKMRKAGAESPRNLEEQALSLIGKDVYELLIKGYTEKQWGRPCRELPAFIIRRLPVRLTFDNNYFNDAFQGIPVGGYTTFIKRLLEGVDVILGCDYHKNRDEFSGLCDRIVYTGRIDEYFDFCLGRLEYRTLRFDTETLCVPNYQGCAVVNYTSKDVPYTRIIEHKHFQVFGSQVYDNPRTIISREFPMEWVEGLEPFYPINNDCNQKLYNRYKELAEKESKVLFGGRLAEYKYYDMAPIVERVLSLFDS